MKPLLILIITFSALLFATNPTMDKYEEFVRQRLIQESVKEDELSQALGTLFGGVASYFVANSTIRHDYLIASFFEAELGNDHLRAIGILDHFIVLETPTSYKTTSQNKQRHQPGKKPNREVHRDSIQNDFKAGPITVSTYGECSPIMDDCESYAVLHYHNQSLKIDSVGVPFHPITKDEVSWRDSRYITIAYGNYSNCSACNGVAVTEFDGDKLFYVGKYSTIEDDYLIKPYDVLEFSEIFPHAFNPIWYLYYKHIGNKIGLDIKKTCSMAKEDYEKDKKGLMAVLSTSKKLDASNNEIEEWSEINITIPLLSTLAKARYCGWQNDYMEILKTAKSNPNNLVTSETLHKVSAELSLVEQPQAEQ